MTTDQILLFTLFGTVLGLLLWGRFRYDVVAFSALIVAVLLGLIDANAAFLGFGHPATIIVALVLVVSKGLMNSGVVAWITRTFVSSERALPLHIASMSSLGAVLSGFMNNVAALALLMPVDLEVAKRAGRSAARTLMPLSFATILGGLITLIGTPPNIIVASIREERLGAPFQMFDFAPVGLACALAGIAFIALIGWRLLPKRADDNAPEDLLELRGYIAELTVQEKSPLIGRKVRDLDDEADDIGVRVLGLVRRGERLPGAARRAEIKAGDHLVVEAAPDAIDTLVGQMKLSFSHEERHRTEAGSDLGLIEAVVPDGSRLDGRSAQSMRLIYRYGVTVLGVSRQGRPFRDRIRNLPLKGGDLLLLMGQPDRLEDTVSDLELLPLAERSRDLTRYRKAGLAAGLFAAAVGHSISS
ncbi:MAG: SLC13 family permease [Pseudomonadota bacterium]